MKMCHGLARVGSIFIFVVFLLLGPRVSCAKEPLDVRVAIIKEAPEVFVSVTGPVQIIDEKTRELLYSSSKGLARSKVSLDTDGSFIVGRMVFKTDGLSFAGQRKASIIVNKRRFRGRISFYKDEYKHLLVVNTLDAESYIRGVLNQEISHAWPLDAIKAQAVAVRTYVLYRRQMNKAKLYDVTADTASQVYGGYLSERRRTNTAVNTTYGEVLAYQGCIFETFFCATCGGISEDAAELWNVDMKPLMGGHVCPFCSESPYFQWHTNVSFDTAEKKLSGYSKNQTGLADIIILERNKTGRVRQLELSYAGGEKVKISGKDFRAFLGPNMIRSTNFYIVQEGDKLIFHGKGWGHGVGLCQHGALGMSRKGYSYNQILEFYYPGAKVIRIY